VTAEESLARLLALAAEAGLRVGVRRPGADEPLTESALCRVRGEVWLFLVPEDPVEHRLRLVGRALREHAPRLLEERWLPPAVRAFLDGPDSEVPAGPPGRRPA
jgi:hypothetical protein